MKELNDVSLADVFDQAKRDIFLSMNCHAIARIESFDTAKQTVKATINYKKTFVEQNATGEFVDVLKDYPILMDCPLVIMGGGNANLTFPKSAIEGSDCLILFNDRDIDNWFQSGQVKGLATSRLHSFSDGIALVGLRHSANSISSYDEARVKLANGTTMVGLSPTQVKIANSTDTLGAVLGNLLTALNTFVTSTSTATTAPQIAAAAATLLPNVVTASTKIAGLLE